MAGLRSCLRSPELALSAAGSLVPLPSQRGKQGGLVRVHQLFGAELAGVIEELNRELVA